MRTIEKYPVADAVNIGTNEEVSIAELVRKIVKLSKKKIKIVFDTTKSDGSPRRNSDNTKAKEKIGFKARVSFDEGLSKTINWYKNVYRK